MFSFLLSIFEQIFFVSFIKTPAYKQPLSQEEEKVYLEKYFEGDLKARDILIERNLRLVAHIAKKYENNKDLQEDLISIGTIGLIASGDQFICREDQVQIIKKHFPQAMCSEMEAASIAQVCYVFSKKFIITRSLSDVFCKGNSSIQFDEYLKKASQSSAKMCLELIKLL